jgi:acetoin utilization deacetylase AcuC-like enzyme
MKIFYCDTFVLPLPEGHRFPMAKYARLRERVIEERLGTLQVPAGATDADLLRVHDTGYLDRVVRGALEAAEVRRIGFPWSPGLVERSRRSVGGTIEAGRAALADGASVNLAGGTHHAFADRGEGFCVFNDVAVASRALQAEGAVRRTAILDLDVHQGNGTAHIFRDDPSVVTLSVHGASNFPFRKEASDLDVALPDRTSDRPFLRAVDVALTFLVRRAKPDLIFYIAGADPFEGDRLGRLSVSRAALREREARVVRTAQEHGIPLAVVMGGGYAHEVDDTANIHLEAVRAAATLTGG